MCWGVQLPTGKSTLVDLLNKNGYRAIEDCDVFKIELNKLMQNTEYFDDMEVGLNHG
ncbi:hypothetical protein ACWYRQ_06855 [Clostridioides difficile]